MLADTWGGRDISTILYPQASTFHYAVLNRRDYAVLTRAGVPADRLHYLPNPLVTNGRIPDRKRARQHLCTRLGIPTTERFLLYPVRAIRRKNVGEALLWSVLGGPAVHVGVTLAPQNLAEQPYYRRWKQCGPRAAAASPLRNRGRARAALGRESGVRRPALTTSVTEGFGMAFLESWVAERALVGRDLPEITADFAAAGLQLDYLYDNPQDPDGLDWPDRVSRHAANGVQRGCWRRTAGPPPTSRNWPAWRPSERPGRYRRLR